MLTLLLDMMIVAVAVRIIAGGDDDDLIKPAIIAVLASIGVAVTNFLVNLYAGNLSVLVGCLAAIAGVVALATKLLMSATWKQSLLVGTVFLVYKILHSVFFHAMISGGS